MRSRKKLLEKTNQRMQDRLNTSERLHRFIVNNSPDIILILDREGNFRFINSKIESILNYSRKDLIGQHVTTIIEDDDIDKVSFYLEHVNVSKTGLPSIDIGIKSHPPSANKRQFELSLYPIVESGEKDSAKHYQIYGTARDIQRTRLRRRPSSTFKPTTTY